MKNEQMENVSEVIHNLAVGRFCRRKKLFHILALLVIHLGSLLEIPYTLKIEKLN